MASHFEAEGRALNRERREFHSIPGFSDIGDPNKEKNFSAAFRSRRELKHSRQNSAYESVLPFQGNEPSAMVAEDNFPAESLTRSSDSSSHSNPPMGINSVLEENPSDVQSSFPKEPEPVPSSFRLGPKPPEDLSLIFMAEGGLHPIPKETRADSGSNGTLFEDDQGILGSPKMESQFSFPKPRHHASHSQNSLGGDPQHPRLDGRPAAFSAPPPAYTPGLHAENLGPSDKFGANGGARVDYAITDWAQHDSGKPRQELGVSGSPASVKSAGSGSRAYFPGYPRNHSHDPYPKVPSGANKGLFTARFDNVIDGKGGVPSFQDVNKPRQANQKLRKSRCCTIL